MRTNSIFFVDPEPKEIMLGYKNLSREKPGFRKRYHTIVKAGSLEEMLVQADVAKYGAVRIVASLIKDGRIEKARTLDEEAKTSWLSKRWIPGQVSRITGG